jgi:hypothetical protein
MAAEIVQDNDIAGTKRRHKTRARWVSPARHHGAMVRHSTVDTDNNPNRAARYSSFLRFGFNLSHDT